MTNTSKLAMGVLAVALLAAAGGYAYLRTAHMRLAQQYDTLLTDFSATPAVCPSRPEQGNAADLYARAFDMLPASKREFELWNAGQVKELGKLPAAEAPLFHLWTSLGHVFTAEPTTTTASRDVLECLGVDAPNAATDPVVRNLDVTTCSQLKLLDSSRRMANSAPLRRDCASPYAPVNGWAKNGKPVYGFMTLASANRLEAHLLEVAGRATEATELRLLTVAMLLDLARDAPLLESIIANQYLSSVLRELASTSRPSDPRTLRKLEEQLERLDAEWPPFYKTMQAEGLWITPTLLLPGVDVERNVRNDADSTLGSESLMIWLAAPAYLDLADDLTAATEQVSLVASIKFREQIDARYADEFFLPLITSEIGSNGYEAMWRVRHAMLRLVRLRLSMPRETKQFPELTDPVTGMAFRVRERQFSSAATDATFQKTVAGKTGTWLPEELNGLMVGRLVP